MQDPSYKLRKAIYAKLNGAITLNAVAVPVYDRVPTTATTPYIYLGEFNYADESTKNSYQSNCTQLIGIKTKYEGDYGGKKDCDDIANQIMDLLRVREDEKLAIDGTLYVVIQNLINSNTFTEQAQGGIVEHRVLRFRFILSEGLTDQYLTPTSVRITNSDDTYDVTVTAASHELPDVTHTDSDGTPVVKPGMVAFVATSIASYQNTGGSGNRTSLITVTTTLTGGAGAASQLINGSITDNVFWRANQAVVDKEIKFDFLAGASKIITEAMFFEGGSITHGIWQWQGSNNDIDWINIGSTSGLGTTVATVQRITTLANNVVGYRYYRLLGISGNWSQAPYIHEFEFKIKNA